MRTISVVLVQLRAAGVSDPWLTSSMSLAPVADELSLGSPVHPENDTESIEEVTKHSVLLGAKSNACCKLKKSLSKE